MKIFSLSLASCIIVLIACTLNASGQTALSLLSAEKPLPGALRSYLTKGSVYSLDEQAVEGLLQTRPTEISLSFHFENKDWVLDLKQSNILSKGFFVSTSNGGQFNYDDKTILHYKGKIRGSARSVAAISIMENELIAVLADETGNINIGALNSPEARALEQHIVFREDDIKTIQPFACGAESLPQAPNPLPQFEVPLSTEDVVNAEPLDIYFEADYTCYQGNGSNVTATANWVTALFNVVNTLYDNDSVYTRISGIKVWSSVDPYSALTSSANVLYAFASNMAGGFPGDLAHILSRRSLGGGVAYLNVLCSNAYFRTAVSGNLTTSSNAYPTYSWNTMVITHEIGHNIVSNHTQWCGWPGGAIDNCAATETGCPRGPAPVNGGTIMSYCHLTSYGINLANGFGPLPGAVVRNAVRSSTCIYPKISFSTNSQIITEESADTDNGCLDYKIINLKIAVNYTPTQPAMISMTATNVASPGLQIGPDKDVDISTLNFILTDTTAQTIQLKVYDDAIIESKETLRLDYSIAANGTNAVKNGAYQLDILSLDHRPDSAPNQLLYFEPFDSIVFGLGPWTQTILHGASSPNRWLIGNSGDAQFLNKAAFVSFNGSTAGYAGASVADSAIIRLESPAINATGFSNMRLSYQYKSGGEGATGQGALGGGAVDFGRLYYSIDNGTNWVLLKDNIYGRSTKNSDEQSLPPSANNAVALKLAFVWQNNSAVVNNPPLIIDSIVIKGTGSSPVQRATDPGNSYEAWLGPNQTVHFYNPATQFIMASLTNKSSFDFGCTTLEIIRTGDSAKVAWGDYAAQKITDKSYRVTSFNNSSTAPYEISLYYTPEEINGWKAATGNTAADMAIVKTSADITQAPPLSGAEFSNYNSIVNHGTKGAKKISAGFTGFSTFSIGKAGITAACPGITQTLSANEVGLSYQWQVNTGGGFTNVVNNSFYAGAAEELLSISNAPTLWYGHKYRCMVTNADSTHASIEYVLKFAVNWVGSASAAWENAANWGCLYLPDANTDVFVKPGAPIYPAVNSNTAVRSLTLQTGANVTIRNTVQLTIVQ